MYNFVFAVLKFWSSDALWNWTNCLGLGLLKTLFIKQNLLKKEFYEIIY